MVDSNLKKVARNFSTIYPIMKDAGLRRIKGLKVASILSDAIGDKPVNTLLDIGCSNALLLDVVTEQLAPEFAVGIDMDSAALPKPTNLRACVTGDAMHLPFASGSIDMVICNHTYEHVPDAHLLFAEIKRVIKPGGIVYFSAMNAAWPMEPHYHLPLIHWMPQRLAQVILKPRGFPDGYHEKPLGLSGLKKLVADFEIRDYTLKVIDDPDKYHANDLIKNRLLYFLFRWLARPLYRLLPGYLWVLVKRADQP